MIGPLFSGISDRDDFRLIGPIGRMRVGAWIGRVEAEPSVRLRKCEARIPPDDEYRRGSGPIFRHK
jgi:hypothetical protein